MTMTNVQNIQRCGDCGVQLEDDIDYAEHTLNHSYNGD